MALRLDVNRLRHPPSARTSGRVFQLSGSCDSADWEKRRSNKGWIQRNIGSEDVGGRLGPALPCSPRATPGSSSPAARPWPGVPVRGGDGRPRAAIPPERGRECGGTAPPPHCPAQAAQDARTLCRTEQLGGHHSLRVAECAGPSHAAAIPIGNEILRLASVGSTRCCRIASARDSATREAAVICTIMNRKDRTGSRVRKAGRPWERSGVHQPLDPPLRDGLERGECLAR